MSTNNDTKKIFALLCERLEKYAQEKRACTIPQKLSDLQKLYPDYRYDPQDDAIRESLTEHVGSLPVVATTLYPFLNRNDVNLGEALIMLAIHDIGELVVGDKITFAKTKDEGSEEQEAALRILESDYHDFYYRVENQTDPTAQFAKAVDKITPDIIDYLNDANHTSQKFSSFMETERTEDIIQMILERKLPYMAWEPKLEKLFRHILDEFHKKLSGAM